MHEHQTTGTITRSPDCLPNARINTLQHQRRIARHKNDSCETIHCRDKEHERKTHLYSQERHFHSRARDRPPHLLNNAP